MYLRRILKSFANAPLHRIQRRNLWNVWKDVALIGAPFSGGQPKGGVEHGPKVLRERGIINLIENLGRTVTDYGDIEVPEYSSEDPELTQYNGYTIKNAPQCGLVSQRLADFVERGAKDDKIVVTIGGDHSIATGTLIGHQRARENVCVVWVDAHNDLNTYKSTNTSNLHGMCLPFVLQGMLDCTGIPGYEWTKPCFKPGDLVYIGLRDVDPEEFVMANELGIPMFSMHDVDRYGIGRVIERAIDIVNPKLDRPIHLSFDIDSVEPFYSPCTGTPVYGGLSLREAMYIGEYINKVGLLGGLDVVEVNPLLSSSERDLDVTAYTAIQVAQAALGKHRSGYVV